MPENTKMTLIEAEQYCWLVSEIALCQQWLEATACEAAQWAENAEVTAALSEYRQTLQANISALERQCERFENWLSGVSDPQIQHWIYLRCVDGLRWTDIGLETGMKPATVRKALHRFFEREAA